jgi:hypothetical protein
MSLESILGVITTVIAGIITYLLQDTIKGSAQKLIGAIKSFRTTSSSRYNLYRSISDILGLDKNVADYLDYMRNLPQPDERADLFAVEKCIELARCPNPKDGWTSQQIEVRLERKRIDLVPEFAQVVKQWRSDHSTESDRIRFVLQSVGGGGLTDSPKIQLTFRMAHFSEIYAIQEILDKVIEWKTGELQTPRNRFYPKLLQLRDSPILNFFVLHVVVLTANNEILITQRSEHVRYYPLKWSIGFEEQLATEDFNTNSPIHAAVIRGVGEELGLMSGLKVDDIQIRSIFIEFDNLNTGAIAIVRLPVSLKDINQMWRDLARDKREFHQKGLFGIPISSKNLSHILIGKQVNIDGNVISRHMWHPTAKYRLLTFMLHHHGTSETLQLLNEAHV